MGDPEKQNYCKKRGIREWAYSAEQVDRRPLLFNEVQGNDMLETVVPSIFSEEKQYFQ